MYICIYICIYSGAHLVGGVDAALGEVLDVHTLARRQLVFDHLQLRLCGVLQVLQVLREPNIGEHLALP